MNIERPHSSDGDDTARMSRSVPVRGPVLAAGLALCAAAMLGAATLGWAGVAILVGFLAAAATLLVRWSR